MRLSRIILIGVALIAAAGVIIAPQIVSAHSAPDLGDPVVVSPSPQKSDASPSPTSSPSPDPDEHADPVRPRAPGAGDEDDRDEDDWDEDDWDEDD